MSHRLGVASTRRGQNRVIVALHGVTDNAASLADIAREYSASWDVVLLDALGHGLSERFTDHDLADPWHALITSAAEAIKVETAPYSTVLLMGHSMGGAIAAHIYAAVPNGITALILEDPALLTADQAAHYAASAPSRIAQMRHATSHPHDAIATLRAQYPAWPPAEVGGWAQAKAQCDQRFLATGVVSGTDDRHHILAGLRVPTLLVSGDRDCLFSERDLRQAAAAPMVTSTQIPGASHTVRRDQPAAFYEAVSEFWDSIPHTF